jgi:hypothetical protein
MTESCIAAIQRGADLRQPVGYREVAIAINTPKSVRAAPKPDDRMGAHGMRSVEHEANELLIRITCDIVALSSKPKKPTMESIARDSSSPNPARSQRSRTGRSETDRKLTERSGALSAPLPSITISPDSPSQSSGSKIPPWAAGAKLTTEREGNCTS